MYCATEFLHLHNFFTLFPYDKILNCIKLKALAEKEKKEDSAINRIFSYSNNVFNPIKDKFNMLRVTFHLSSAKAFNLDKVKILSCVKVST